MPQTTHTQPNRVQQVLADLQYERVVAVIRTEQTADALWGTEQLITAGIRAFDVTFSVPGADTVIRRLRESQPDAIVGAGTILTLEDARRALDALVEVVVAGVTDMQLTYREEGINEFRTADNVGTWANVNAVMIALTVQSADQRVTTDVTVNAGRIERRFSNIVALRNRVP